MPRKRNTEQPITRTDVPVRQAPPIGMMGGNLGVVTCDICRCNYHPLLMEETCPHSINVPLGGQGSQPV